VRGGATAAAKQGIEAAALAARATPSSRDQAAIVANLAGFPTTALVRGIFFEGLGRVVTATRSAATWADLVRAAGAPPQPVAFRQYPHVDFYRLYYLAAPVLRPNVPFGEALRLTAREFFPIFRNSMLGRTMTAFMGSEPVTILPLVAKAYNVSVTGNEHATELSGDRRVVWRCSVEPVEWYEQTFTGIVEGAAPPGTALKVAAVSKSPKAARGLDERVFEITW
jgi:uncharacterized protein (TIGR02265 family)